MLWRTDNYHKAENNNKWDVTIIQQSFKFNFKVIVNKIIMISCKLYKKVNYTEERTCSTKEISWKIRFTQNILPPMNIMFHNIQIHLVKHYNFPEINKKVFQKYDWLNFMIHIIFFHKYTPQHVFSSRYINLRSWLFLNHNLVNQHLLHSHVSTNIHLCVKH